MPPDPSGGYLVPMQRPPHLKTDGFFGLRILSSPLREATRGLTEATAYLTLMSIPVLPFRRYRIRGDHAEELCFFGIVPLRRGDRLAQVLALLLVAVLAYAVFSNSTNSARPTYRAESPGPSTSYTQQAPAYSSAPVSESRSPDSYQEASPPSGQQQSLQLMRLAIDQGKAQVRQLESQLTVMDSELNSMSSRLKSSKLDIELMESNASAGLSVDESMYRTAIEEHNLEVDRYNRKLAERRNLYGRYETLLGVVNRQVDEYNAMIRR